MKKRDMLEPKAIPPRGILHRRPDAPIEGYARYWPDEDLRPFVEHLWTVEWNLDVPRRSEVLTHPSVQVVLERDDSRVAGVFTKRFVREFRGPGRVLGVKFLPGGFRAFYPHPIATLRDRSLPLVEVYPDARGLEEAALLHADHSAAFAVIQDFLRRFEPRRDPQAELAAQLTARVATRRDIVRVEQIAAEADLGVRTLQRLFDEYVGVSPKWIIQRYRLHEAAERIAAGEVRDFADLALELGYADQAHFIRDFKKLVGRTPGEYARSL